MKTMKIRFFFTEIGREKRKILIFHNISVRPTVADIILKLCMLVLHIVPEGNVSQIFYLGPSFYFMKS